ncbi:hypothetical protein A1O1_00924 [Capronia coronata CBS 617.96]|uniref:Uncharacterized protein n=1 Tax=Capronia coronata CBS 617.96 TaxID=1182541 RepID=W9Z1G0_9EURO|nr:uncharacterized protein A1O1_00924 [Capronia coronata CBS 617.96]EXJ95800.1 hypothetical protein A1O1_00924 [Capronia coronata CBS 617.96]
MGTIPAVLIAEVRIAFQSCARQYASTRRTHFSTLRPLLKKSQPVTKADNLPIQVVHSQIQAQKKTQSSPTLPPNPQASKELIPVGEEQNAVDSGRKVEVPLKVIPKAEVAPNLTLSPRERLHIEQLTRRLPPRSEPKVYKTRFRIYTAGNGRIYMLTFLRFSTIIALCFVTAIVVPAHYLNGSPIWLVAGVWLAAFIPFVFVNWTLRPMVTEVFLRLPPSVQHSPKLAMEYAKSLPADSALDLRFMRASTLTDLVTLKIANTRPAKSSFRPVSFEWFGPLVERGGFLRRNPTQFYVRPESANGKAARDVTPGLWSKVYERLTGMESSVVSKWRR